MLIVFSLFSFTECVCNSDYKSFTATALQIWYQPFVVVMSQRGHNNLGQVSGDTPSGRCWLHPFRDILASLLLNMQEVH